MAVFQAGVAEVNITPPVGTSICGFAGRKGPAESIHDELHARALVLANGGVRFCIVAADVIGFAPDLVTRIRGLAEDAAGLPGSHLMLCASHTHSGPTVMAFRSMGARDDAYEDVLCRKVAGAVKMASDNLADVSLSTGRAPVRIGYNRREFRDGRTVLGHNPTGPEAPWVDVLRVDLQSGTPLALLFSSASHPVNLGGLEISAEFPGYAAGFVARNLGAVPLFAQGCCGDINCAPRDGTHAMSERLGMRLGSAALAAALDAASVESGDLAVATRAVDLPVRVPAVEEAEAAREQEQARFDEAGKDPSITAYRRRHQFGGQLAWSADYLREAQKGPSGQSVRFHIQAARVGSAAFVAYPGEMFVDYQLTLDRKPLLDPTFVFGYSNGCIGYVPTAKDYAGGGYEVERAYRYYGTLMITEASEGIIKRATAELLGALA